MPTYKGNGGNLMQHWTLCELVNIADQHAPGLHFIDAHAMAPWATECPRPDSKFVRVRDGLADGQSVYEQAWYQLAPSEQEGYPNSANFVQHLWTQDLSMLLCEIDCTTATALDTWLAHVQRHPRCRDGKVFHGDWWDRFHEGLPRPWQVGLPDGSLTLVSFDLNMYDRNGPPQSPQPENMYPPDLCKVVSAISDFKEAGVLIQLSTYSANNDNAQTAVLKSVDNIISKSGFCLAAKARLDGNMMSLVYTRNVPWADKLANLPKCFRGWLRSKTNEPGH